MVSFFYLCVSNISIANLICQLLISSQMCQQICQKPSKVFPNTQKQQQTLYPIFAPWSFPFHNHKRDSQLQSKVGAAGHPPMPKAQLPASTVLLILREFFWLNHISQQVLQVGCMRDNFVSVQVLTRLKVSLFCLYTCQINGCCRIAHGKPYSPQNFRCLSSVSCYLLLI